MEQSYISGLFLVVYRPNNDLFRFFAAKSKNISLNQLHQNRGGGTKGKAPTIITEGEGQSDSVQLCSC